MAGRTLLGWPQSRRRHSRARDFCLVQRLCCCRPAVAALESESSPLPPLRACLSRSFTPSQIFNVQITHGERRRRTRARQRDRAGRVRGRRRAPPPLAPRPNHRCSLERSKGKRTHLGGSPRGSKTRGWGGNTNHSREFGVPTTKSGRGHPLRPQERARRAPLRLQRSLVTTCPHKETQQRQSRRPAPHNSALATKRDRGA